MTWDAFSAIANAVAAFAAVGAIIWAVVEFRRRRIADLDARAAEILGVTLTFEDLHVPRESEMVDGHGQFHYTFVLHNPGRLPIGDVRVQLLLPGAIGRVYRDATDRKDPTDRHELVVPTVAARGRHHWRRDFDVPRQLWHSMADTTAEIEFSTPDAGRHTTYWPPRFGPASPELLERIKAIAPQSGSR